jgi:hypothetical protein
VAGIDEITFPNEEPTVTNSHAILGGGQTIQTNDPDPTAAVLSGPIRRMGTNQPFSL